MFKYLIILLAPVIIHAESWRAMEDPNSKAYATQQLCDADEATTCYDVTGKDPRLWKVENGSLVTNQAAVDQVAAEAADRSAKETKILQIRTDLIACAKDWPSLTTAARLVCARKNIALSVYTSLTSGDL